MSKTITINVPDKLYSQLQRTAELSGQPLESLVTQSLAYSVPPLLEEIPLTYQSEIYALLQMNDTALHREAISVYPPEQWSEHKDLLSQKKLRELTTAEQNRLEVLQREANILTLRKSYAVLLLNRRSYLRSGWEI